MDGENNDQNSGIFSLKNPNIFLTSIEENLQVQSTHTMDNYFILFYLYLIYEECNRAQCDNTYVKIFLETIEVRGPLLYTNSQTLAIMLTLSLLLINISE